MFGATYIEGIKLTIWRKEIIEELIRFNEKKVQSIIPVDIHYAVRIENELDEGGIDWSECKDSEFKHKVRAAVAKLTKESNKLFSENMYNWMENNTKD